MEPNPEKEFLGRTDKWQTFPATKRASADEWPYFFSFARLIKRDSCVKQIPAMLLRVSMQPNAHHKRCASYSTSEPPSRTSMRLLRLGKRGGGIYPLCWGPEIFGRTQQLCRSNRAEVAQRRGRRKLRTDQSDINKGHTLRSRGRGLRTFVLLYLEQLYK